MASASSAACREQRDLCWFAPCDAPPRARAVFDRVARCRGRSRLLVPQHVRPSVVVGRAIWAFGALNATVHLQFNFQSRMQSMVFLHPT